MIRKMIVPKGWLLFLTLIVISPYSASQESISWQMYHRPPGIIKIGDDAGQGFVQKTLKLIIERLPEYEHRMPLTTLARAISDIKAGKQVCHPALFVTKERLEYMYYSNASMVNPTNRIITRKGMFDQFVRDGNIKLNEALQDKDLTVAVVNGRSYTEVIDNMLVNFVDKNNIFQMSSTDLSPIFHLIELSRVDATIAYPFELGHYNKNNLKSAEQLQAYQIAGIPQYNIGSVACPKNEWGKQVITKVNAILAEIKSTPEYQHALTTWWQAERDNPQFKRFYQDVFLTH